MRRSAAAFDDGAEAAPPSPPSSMSSIAAAGEVLAEEKLAVVEPVLLLTFAPLICNKELQEYVNRGERANAAVFSPQRSGSRLHQWLVTIAMCFWLHHLFLGSIKIAHCSINQSMVL